MASKKKRKSFATRSSEADSDSQSNYTLLSTYIEYIAQLEEACQQGDADSKEVIEQLAPQMAATLKFKNLWETPPVPLEDVPPQISIVTDLNQLSPPDPDFMTVLNTRELGPISSTEVSRPGYLLQEDDSNQAIVNLIVDVALLPTSQTCESESSCSYLASNVGKGSVVDKVGDLSTLLKGLQPQREVPSKGRGKRFAAGQLLGNRPLHTPGNEVQKLAFWTVFPESKALKLFLLGQISLILN